MTDTTFQDRLSEGQCPCIPPEDYHGSIADWQLELIQRGHWDGDPENWYGDVWVSSDEWWGILEACEGVQPGDCSLKCDGDNHHESCRVTEPKP